MRLRFILPLAFILVVAFGCSSTPKKTAKETAAAKWNATRAKVLYGLAKGQYDAGNFDESRKTINEGLALDAENPTLRVLSARLAIEQGQLEFAEKECAAARKSDPKEAEADYLCGVIYQRWQKPETAYQYYTAASEKAPAELAYILARGESLVAMNRQPEAIQLLQEKVVYFENSAVIRDAVGQLFMQVGRYSEAVEMLQQASILATDDQTIQEHLGLAMFYARQFREAADVIGKLVQVEEYKKRADLFIALGKSQVEIGKLREARQSLETAAQLNPGSFGVWLSMAHVALQANDLKRTDLSIRKAIALEADNSEARLLLGYLRLREGRLNDALAAFQKASALDRRDTVSLCMVGYSLQKMGRIQQAQDYYSQALKIKPGDEMASRLLASIELKD